MPKSNIYIYFSYAEYQISKIFENWKKCFTSQNIVNTNNDSISRFYQNLLNFDAICDYFIVTRLFNYFSDKISLQTGIVVITTPQLHTTKPKFRFFAGS